MRLIDADYLKQMFDVACGANREVFNIADSVYNFAIKTIDDAPTVELDESIIQDVLNKRCMTVVTNEYLRGGKENDN